MVGRQLCHIPPADGRLQQGSGGGVVVGGSRNSVSGDPQLHWSSLRAAAGPRVDGAAPTGALAGAPLGGCEDRSFAFLIGGDQREDIPMSFVPPQFTSDDARVYGETNPGVRPIVCMLATVPRPSSHGPPRVVDSAHLVEGSGGGKASLRSGGGEWREAKGPVRGQATTATAELETGQRVVLGAHVSLCDRQ
ncbi:hypothetical protein Dimus_020606, partial [Dionaea muscipula]